MRVQKSQRPDFLTNSAETVSITLEEAGVVVVPSAGTYTLRDAAGTAVTGLDGVSATTLGGTSTMTYNIPDGTLTDVVLGNRYTSRFLLTIGGNDFPYEREAFLVRVPFTPPITDDDLIGRLSDLYGDDELPTDKPSWQPYIEEADRVIIARMLAEAIQPGEITSWYAFREVYMRYTLGGIAFDLRVGRSGSSMWKDLYDELYGPVEDPKSIEWAWANKGYRLDTDGDGTPDADGASEAKPGGYWNNSDGGGRGF